MAEEPGVTYVAPHELVPVGPEWLNSALQEAEADGEELWVDGTVLKCCNQAYELAVAHRSANVRLEHLVHAMTVIPEAIERLRASGISDATLRRESGIILAHEIPAHHGTGQQAPRASDEMEEVLRHAAERAYALRSPVTVEDILQTLFAMTRDTTASHLLNRHRADWQLHASPANGGHGYQPPGAAPTYTGAPHGQIDQGGLAANGGSYPGGYPGAYPSANLGANPGANFGANSGAHPHAHQSNGGEPPSAGLGQQPQYDPQSPRHGSNPHSHSAANSQSMDAATSPAPFPTNGSTPTTMELPSSGSRPASNLETTMSIPTVTDSYQNNRIDALERLVRELADALHGRVRPAPLPRISDPSPRDDEGLRANSYGGYDRGRESAELLNRISDIEATVDLKFRELARTWNVLGDRLQSLEDTLVSDDKRDSPMKRELERLAISIDRLRSLEGLPNRLDRIDAIVAKLDRMDRSEGSEALEQTLSAIAFKLERLERGEGSEVMESRLNTISAKLDRLERLERNDGSEVLEHRLNAIATKLDQMDRSDAPEALDSKIGAIALKLDRLDRLDMTEAFDKKLGAMETTFSRLLRRIDGLESKLDNSVDGDFDLTPVRERLDALTRAVHERPSPHAELAPLNHKIDGLTRTMANMGSTSVDMRPISERLDKLERTISERSTSGIDFGPLMDRFKDLDSRIGDNSLVIEAIGDRIDTFEGNIDTYRAQLAQTSSSLGTEIKAVASAVSAQSAQSERLQNMVSQGISTGGGSVDPDLIAGAVSRPLHDMIGDVRSLVDTDRKEQREQFEYLVQGLKRSDEDHRNDLTEVHEAMLKLNANQQTLAQSMDRWRLDVTGDLGILAQRLESVEHNGIATPATGANSERIDELTTRLETVSTYLERRQKQREGFFVWLFGTEDWWSDGWRTPEEREAIAIQEGRLFKRREGFDRPEDRALRS